MKKIFFFDIDGTLAIHGVIPKSNLKALQLLKEQGHYTFICTGRSPFYAQNLFADLVDGLITCNGRYILYHGQKLHGEAFSKEELYSYQEKIKKLGAGAMFVSDDVAIPYLLDKKQIQEIQKEYGKHHIQLLSQDLSFYTFDLFYHSLSKRDELIEAFAGELVINDHGGHGSCDCSTIGFDKGNGIAYLLNYFHIDKADAYAFGDGYNDQAMFREVGHAIAMGNAVEELKQKATYITDSIDNDGIIKALIHEGIA